MSLEIWNYRSDGIDNGFVFWCTHSVYNDTGRRLTLTDFINWSLLLDERLAHLEFDDRLMVFAAFRASIGTFLPLETFFPESSPEHILAAWKAISC